MNSSGFGEGSLPRHFNLESFQQPPGCYDPMTVKQIKMLNIVDSSGIPLESDRAPADLISEIDFRYGPFPYNDSPSRNRYRQPPIPMSFLEHERLKDNYPDLLKLEAELREEFLSLIELYGGDKTTRLSLPLAITFLGALKFLPTYLVCRAESPFAVHGEVPPAVIALSNTSSGTMGALWGYIQTRMQFPDQLPEEPTAEAIVADAERRGNMVGEKTVCVAKPAMMRNFINAVLEGPIVPKQAQLSMSELIKKGEITNLLQFSHSITFCSEALAPLSSVDKRTAEQVERMLRLGHSDRRIRDSMMDYLDTLHIVLGGVTIHQVRINAALKRQAYSPEISIADYEGPLNLQMPSIIDRLTRNQIPEPYASGEQRFHIGDINPNLGIWDLLAISKLSRDSQSPS